MPAQAKVRRFPGLDPGTAFQQEITLAKRQRGTPPNTVTPDKQRADPGPTHLSACQSVCVGRGATFFRQKLSANE